MTRKLPASAEILKEASSLAPEALRDRVKNMTNADLEALIHKMDSARKVPEVFRNSEVHAAIEERIQALGETVITEKTRQRWQHLRTTFEKKKAEMEDKAEKSFIKDVMKKGGIWAVLGGAGIAALSWLGIGWAKKLKSSIKEKGLLKTAIEGAKEHPILTALLAAAGFSTGTLAYQYFTDNKDAIVDHVDREAKASGKDPLDIAQSLGGKLKQFVANAGSTTIDGLVKGTAYILGGTVDAETGMVTLPHSSLRPPFMVAYQAGVRRRHEGKVYSLFAMENTLDSIVKDAERGFHQTNEQRLNADRAKRLRAIIRKEAGGKPLSATEMNEKLSLTTDLKKTGALTLDPMNRNVDRKSVLADLKAAEKDLARQYGEEVEIFNRKKQALLNRMAVANEHVRAGTIPGGLSASDYIKGEKLYIEQESKGLAEELFGKKSKAARRFANAYNAAAGHQLTANTGMLEGATRSVEKCGIGIIKNKAGKCIGYAGKAYMLYSTLPILTEAVSSAAHGEFNPLTSKRAQTAALDIAQVGGGFIPVVGEAMDFYSAISGKDLNGRQLDTQSRVIMAAMGTLGTASIGLGFFTGGLSVVAFRGVRTAMAGRKAWQVARVAQTVARTAKTADKIEDTAKAGRAAIQSVEAFSNTARLQKTTRAMQAQRLVRTGQRGMQLYVYGHLGFNMVSGTHDFVCNLDESIEAGKQRIIRGIDMVLPGQATPETIQQPSPTSEEMA